MKLNNKKIVLTGGAGGLGTEMALKLAKNENELVLIGRSQSELDILANRIADNGGTAFVIAADLLAPNIGEQLEKRIIEQLGRIDVLINAAGMISFKTFAEEDAKMAQDIMQLNSVVPMLLTRQFLPAMIERSEGKIVNVGSTFGSIAFACFASYSASKFALRGFSEALRRELKGTGVSVSYIAPRAIKTPFNSAAVYKMAEVVGMNMDEPEWVAEKIIKSIEKDDKDVYLGFPEKVFVRINAILPRLVDKALSKQNNQMAHFASQK